MGYRQADTGQIKKTVAGRAIHTVGRQPIVPQQGTGYAPNYVPKVPATSIQNPLQRQPNYG